MKPVARVIWYIESHYQGDINLDDLAGIANVSKFYLSRAFAMTTGVPVSRYLRHRRLSEAARKLAAGESDILGLALATRYGSHEAFSRAFKECFGMTPEQVRKQGHTGNLVLTEARKMHEIKAAELNTPDMISLDSLLIAGLSRTHSMSKNTEIPGQWQDFLPHFGRVPGQKGQVAYGVICNADEENNFDYLCGVEVTDFSQLPKGFARIRLASQKYAVFSHGGHVSEIQNVCAAIWGNWLPESGLEAADAPFFERYPESFDARTGNGGFEIWLPVKN